jgi:hypothetical protein
LCLGIPIRFIQDADCVPLRAGLKPAASRAEVWPLVGHLFSSRWLSDPRYNSPPPVNTGCILSTETLRLLHNRGICVAGCRKETEQGVGLRVAQRYTCLKTFRPSIDVKTRAIWVFSIVCGVLGYAVCKLPYKSYRFEVIYCIHLQGKGEATDWPTVIGFIKRRRIKFLMVKQL